MEIINLDNHIEPKYQTAVALGNFDGIHTGHRHLILSMVNKAKKNKLKSSVLLFKSHTRETLKKQEEFGFNILTSVNQKLKIMEKLGVEVVYIMSFNKNIMRLTKEEFVNNIIIDKLNAKLVTVGFDYKFGYKAAGDSTDLENLGLIGGFLVDVIDPISLSGEIISSTSIRKMIRSGNIKKANKFLGYFYAVEGSVIGGKGRGRRLGFPTANIKLREKYVIPASGVYKTNVFLKNKKYPSITCVGFNPTFNEKELKIETHILDFNDSIYDDKIKIEFTDFIRENIKFNTTENLIKQIEIDIQSVKKL